MTALRVTRSQKEYLVSLEWRGRLTVNRVLADAQRPDSPLHSLYDWDTQRAARKYWEERTRQIIRTVKYAVPVDAYTVTVNHFVPDPDRGRGEQGYVSVPALRENPARARRELIEEFERAASILKRAVLLAVVLGMESRVRQLLDEVINLREIVRTHGGGHV